jgi:predicted RNA binding protein YcfA (HicA-like mRNA interferase family)
MRARRAPPLPARLPTKRVHAALQRLGFEPRECGSHTVFVDPEDRGRRIVVPRHAEVKGVVLRQNLHDVGITDEEFMAAY